MRAAVIRAARVCATLLLPVAWLTACSDSTGPAEETDPEPTFVYDLVVETRYINVRGTCDLDDFGNPAAGEFQYRIVVSGAGKSYSFSTSGYNQVTGEHISRTEGSDINFTNRSYQWRDLSRSAKIDVELAGAEWDGLSKDGRMANRSGTVTVPFELDTNTRSITIGATASCQIRLYYDATWYERRIE